MNTILSIKYGNELYEVKLKEAKITCILRYTETTNKGHEVQFEELPADLQYTVMQKVLEFFYE